jgi:hypothetical protein
MHDIRNRLQLIFLSALSLFSLLCAKDTGVSISPNLQALKNLAAFSIDEEFCQKFGGKVFGHTGAPNPAYRQLCLDYAFLLDRMARNLMALKNRIPAFEDHGEDDLGSHAEDDVRDNRKDGLRAYPL